MPSRHVTVSAVIALLAVIAVLSLSGVVSGETTNEAEISVEAPDIIVEVDAEAVGENETVTVVVSAEGETADEVIEPSDDAGERYRESIPITEFDLPEYENATIEVHAGNETIASEASVDLRYVELDTMVGTDGLQLTFGVSEAIGVSDGTTVRLETSVGSASGPDLQARYDPDTEQLIVDRTDGYQQVVESGSEITIEERTGSGADIGVIGTVEFLPAEMPATVIPARNGTVTVESGFMFDDRTYDFVVETDAPEGTYVTGVTADDGVASIDNPAVLSAETVNVHIYRNGTEITSGFASTAFEVNNATVVNDGSGLAIDAAAGDGANHTLSGEGTVDRLYLQVRDERHTFSEVQYTNGTVDLTSAGVELNADGAYDLVVVDDEIVRATVDGDAADSEINEIDDDTGTILIPSVPLDRTALLVAGAVALLLLGGGVGLFVMKRGRSVGPSVAGGSDERASSDDASAGQQTDAGAKEQEVTVRLLEERDGTPIERRAEVTFVRKGTTRTIETDDGEAVTELSPGEWTVAATVADERRETTETIAGSKEIDLRFPPRSGRAQVVDDWGSVADVTIQYETDLGETGTVTTDPSGEFELTLPLAVTEVSATIDHPRYETQQIVGLGQRIHLEPLRGDVSTTARIDGTPVEGIEIELVPDEEFTETRSRALRERADRQGRVQFDGLVVGQYRLRMATTELDSIPSVTERVTVPGGKTATASLDAPFEFSLGERHRQRIDALRREIDGLSLAKRDVAIPWYYGTVCAELLDLIEDVPNHGAQFAQTGIEPDRLVTALLDVTADTIDLTQRAMTTKQNVDLFGACVNMREVRVEWSGSFQIGTLFDRFDDDITRQRTIIADRLDEVNSKIAAERGSVRTIDPVREQYDSLRGDLTNGTDEVDRTIRMYVALGMLDAIEEVFDHPELVDRLDQTVF